MPKIKPYEGKNSVRVGGAQNADPKVRNARWWTLNNKRELAESLFGVVKFLRQTQNFRQHQAALFARLYGNMPIWNYLGVNLSKLNTHYRFPSERPTMNVVQSCVDALVARIVQSRPKPMFITDGGDYKKRVMAKQLNKFIDGEFYQTKAYEVTETVLRDACILGDGVIKIFQGQDKKVKLERVLPIDILVDESDGMNGRPQQMHQLKIVDRDVMAETFPTYKSSVMTAEAAFFDSSTESKDSIVSQIMVCESWHLPSGPDAKDGRHVIAINNAVLLDEPFKKDKFPFVFFKYSPRPAGFWAQGLAEQLMGLQNEINRLLYTIQQGLQLCAIPKWLVEDGSKVVSAHINNQIGGIIRYQGIKPELATYQVFPPELYSQLERLVQKAYQQSGVSQLNASGQKPMGLNSGVALREFDNIQTDRFSYISQRWERLHTDLGDAIFDCARDIAQEEGTYETIYPGKGSLLKIELPKLDPEEDPFIIQTFPVSAMPKNPAERKEHVIELMQSGLIEPQEGRRLLDYPDLDQEERLLNAPEERILKILDEIVEEGKYTPPDPFMDLQKAKTLVIQYYNQYLQQNLEEEKAALLRAFSTQVDALNQSAMAAMAPPTGGMSAPQAPPQPIAPSPMVPNVPQAA